PNERADRSRLADRLDHRRGDRLLGRLAAPDDELERRIEALAFGERDINQILDLLDASAVAAAQQHALAERGTLIVSEIEMADPQPLVHHRQQLMRGRTAAARHLEFEAAGILQGVDRRFPYEMQAIGTPATNDLDHHFIVARAVV